MKATKEFKILPRAVVRPNGTMTVIAMASYGGYRTIEDVIARIKSDRLCFHKPALLAAIAAGMYWETI